MFGLTAYGAETRSPSTRVLNNAGGPGYRIAWRASKNVLARAPRWDGRGEPPLSVGSAVRIARKYLASRGSTAAVAMVEHVHLRQGYSDAGDYLPGEERPEYFVYSIEFAAPVGVPLWKPERLVLVLLDGSVVPPTVTFVR